MYRIVGIMYSDSGNPDVVLIDEVPLEKDAKLMKEEYEGSYDEIEIQRSHNSW